MKKVALHTLGCKLNFSETSTIARSFEDRGFRRVEFSEIADVYVLNTCSVTDNADRKCRKEVRRVLRLNPDAFIVVMGCYAQLKPQEISEIEGVDLVLGAKEKFNLFEHIEDFTKGHSCSILASEIEEVDEFKSSWSLGDRTRTFLKIQDGCDYNCSFCTIPLARGKSRSDSLENITENARQIARSGVKEIVLTGVNIGDYGKDQPHNFFDVVQALDEIEGIERFRISSIEPNLLSDEIIEFTAGSRKFMPHFHIPLQSGNDELLGKMRRRYKSSLYADRVSKIKSLMPHACIGVDVIVGFPGESKEHFLHTCDFLKELEVSYFHVFTYSERNNTLAPTLQGSVPVEERMERSRMLRNISTKKKRAFEEQFKRSSRLVLWEEENKNGKIYGHTDNYIKVSSVFEQNLGNRITPFTMSDFDSDGNMTGRIPSESLIC